MRRVLAVMLAACLSAGCAGPKKAEKPPTGAPAPAKAAEPSGAGKGAKQGKPETPASSPFSMGFVERYAGSRKLAHAVEQLGKGNQAAAVKELTAICNGAPMPGVTDEALFRLALLTLKPAPDRPGSPQGVQLLRRLRKEYPASSWAVQAAPLLDLVGVADDLRQQNRSLRSNNQSLTREINELNKTINELKQLDMELEQKRR